MHIEILHVPGCPNLELARARLSVALERARITASMRDVIVTSAETAEKLEMRGSPTIRIDGRDPFDQGLPEGSLGCRLYWSRGRPDGAPALSELIAALSAAAAEH